MISNTTGRNSKIRILTLLPFIGIILSCIFAFKYINFQEILNMIIQEKSILDMLNNLEFSCGKWLIFSFFAFLLGIVLMFLYCIPSKNNESFTCKQFILFSIILIFICQIILPVFFYISLLATGLLYFVFVSSTFLKNIIGLGAEVFSFLTNLFLSPSEKTTSYGSFIGEEKYSIFLTMITFLISIPYIFSFLIKIVKSLVGKCTGNKELTALIFKPIVTLTNVNILRYILYIILFFTSIYTYSLNITKPDYILSIFKESLLEFVLLDTVIYSIYDNLKTRLKNNKYKKLIKYYLPYKYDLEFILSAINIYNLKDKSIASCINFSSNQKEILKAKHQKSIEEIDILLMDISTNHYSMDILEAKIKLVLNYILFILDKNI